MTAVALSGGLIQAGVLSFLRYDVELFQRIEHLIGKKLPAFPMQEEEVMMLTERVAEAQRFARMVGAVPLLAVVVSISASARTLDQCLNCIVGAAGAGREEAISE